MQDQELWNPGLADIYEERKAWMERRMEEEGADKERDKARERAGAVAGA